MAADAVGPAVGPRRRACLRCVHRLAPGQRLVFVEPAVSRSSSDLPTAVLVRGKATAEARPRRRIWLSAFSAAAGAALLLGLARCSAETPPRLLLAPIVQGVDLCSPAPGSSLPGSAAELASYCRQSGRSAADIIETALSQLGPVSSRNGKFEVGYTLPVFLLGLFEFNGSVWDVDQRAVDRLALTVRESNRPVILYLFSTHFGTKAPMEDHLAKDPANMSVSPLGPMPKDRYYGSEIYPWTFASTENTITHYRQLAIGRFVDAVCRLPTDDRRKIRAVTLLGEVHHFHADFERGMGVTGPYVVSDYSEASVRGFRAFLAQRFGDVQALNKAVGEHYSSFAEVEPPSKDIRTQTLGRFTEHIDSFAHGKLPLIGWAIDPISQDSAPTWIRIYRNGRLTARVAARYGRQDVLQAKPAIGTADVGWRYDLDFSDLPHGVHRLDFFAERAAGGLAHLGTRRVALMARDGAPPRVLAAEEQLPAASDASGLEFSIDHPPDSAAFFYNPLVPLWHEFRNAQVVAYLGHFEREVRRSCLTDVDLYIHQIAPFVNPSWDTTKFAVDASLNDPGSLRLGISLYGESTYGKSFFDWLDTTKHRSYGITEFHPMRAMPTDEARAMLERHRQRGATFVSFFVDARPHGVRAESERNIFAFDPDNPNFGSDKLHATMRAIVNE